MVMIDDARGDDVAVCGKNKKENKGQLLASRHYDLDIFANLESDGLSCPHFSQMRCFLGET
jgi:hypothetical protein